MNILFFTRCMGSGGTEKVILQLCKALIGEGHRVIVCAASGNGVEDLKENKIRYYEIPDIQKKSMAVFIRTIHILLNIIKREKVTVVHTHHRMAAFYLYLLRPFVQIKTLNTIHNTFDDKKIITRILFNNTYNIAVGDSVKKNMVIDYKIKENHITVIHNAIDDKVVETENLEWLSNLRKENFVVGNIGRVNEQKGFDYYIDAALAIKKQGLPIKFLIIGDGVMLHSMKKKVEENDLEESVIFTGFQKNILNIIRQLDLVVLSSLWEGFPLTPIETFSMKKTIVVTDVPGNIEIVENRKNGLVVEKKNGIAIANAVVELYENKDYKKRLEENAYDTYVKEYSYQAFCSKYLELYHRTEEKYEQSFS